MSTEDRVAEENSSTGQFSTVIMSDVADVLGLEKTNAVDSKAMDPHMVAMTAVSKRGGTRKGGAKKSQPKPPGMSREVMCVCVFRV